MGKDRLGEETGRNSVAEGTQIDERIWGLGELGLALKGAQINEISLNLKDQDEQLVPGLKPFQRQYMERLFIAQGKLHFMSSLGIYLHDIDMDETFWTDMHSFLFAAIGQADSVRFAIFATQVVNDELLIVVDCHIGHSKNCQRCYLRSKGFSCEKKEIVWEKVGSSLSLEHSDSPYMCPVMALN